MDKFLFTFSNGVCCTIPAASKLKAVEIVSSKFNTLFEKESVTISALTYELDEAGKIITG